MKVTMTIDHLKRFGGLYLFLVTYVSDYMFVPTLQHVGALELPAMFVVTI
jgi:hypothetical protein